MDVTQNGTRRLSETTCFTFRFEKNENIVDTPRKGKSGRSANAVGVGTYTGPLTFRMIDRLDEDVSMISTRTCVHWP